MEDPVTEEPQQDQECSDETPTKEGGVCPQSGTVLKSTTSPVENDQRGFEHEEPQSDAPNGVDQKKKEESDTSGGTQVPINEGSGDKPDVSPQAISETTVQGSDNEKLVPQEAPAAKKTVTEKDVETIEPAPSTPSSGVIVKGVDQKKREGDKFGGTQVPINKGDNSDVSPEVISETTVQESGNEKPVLQKAPAAKQTVTEKDVETIEPAPSTPSSGVTVKESETQEPVLQKAPAAKQTVTEKDVETIGPAPSTPSSGVTVKESKRRKVWIAALVALVAVLLPLLLQTKDPPQKKDLHQIDIFHQEFNQMKVQFPSQREELWKRSRIHLQRHFHVAQPTEPVSMILTAGVRAEGTLRCLALSIAAVLSSALNASAIHFDGVSKSTQDSDEVKSELDGQLQKAFKGGKPIAVIQRFEELPPASTLIFYRYCDHENAAFKKTFLIFTVLLSEEEEIQANIRLSEVEEMVTDHLQKKFISHGHPTAFDKMDMDKYGGLWSRISHLILPVATEKRFQKTAQC